MMTKLNRFELARVEFLSACRNKIIDSLKWIELDKWTFFYTDQMYSGYKRLRKARIFMNNLSNKCCMEQFHDMCLFYITGYYSPITQMNEIHTNILLNNWQYPKTAWEHHRSTVLVMQYKLLPFPFLWGSIKSACVLSRDNVMLSIWIHRGPPYTHNPPGLSHLSLTPLLP